MDCGVVAVLVPSKADWTADLRVVLLGVWQVAGTATHLVDRMADSMDGEVVAVLVTCQADGTAA